MQTVDEQQRPWKRLGLWALVAAYTLALPQVIIVYGAIETFFSRRLAERVPLALIVLTGCACLFWALRANSPRRALVLMIPAGLLAAVLTGLLANPSKQIHIPEYIVMAGLLFAALKDDYQGKGLEGLIFICGSLLGVVDEILQGIHPARFYGGPDMVVNAGATLVGVILLAGLRRAPQGDWRWLRNVKNGAAAVAILLAGMGGAALMGLRLAAVRGQVPTQRTYPAGLLAFNVVFLAVGAALIVRSTVASRRRQIVDPNRNDPWAGTITARLWLLSLLAILMVMHALGIVIVVGKLPFR